MRKQSSLLFAQMLAKNLFIIVIASLGVFVFIGYLSTTVAHNSEKIRAHIKEDIINVVAARSSGDIHTECLTISGAIAPNNESRTYILDPKMLVSSDPCVGLQDTLRDQPNVAWVSYSRYWMGSTFLCLLLLNSFNLSSIHILYMSLITISLALLGVSGFVGLRKDLRIPLLVASVGIYAGIGVRLFGGHIGHSPVYFLSFFALAALIMVRFKTIGQREASIIGCVLGSVSGFYDILSGAIPFFAALSLFVYYLLWKSHASKESTFKDLFFCVAVLMASYLGAISVILGIKLIGFLTILHRPDALTDFVTELALRMSSDGVPGNEASNIFYVFRRLWWNNGNVYIGGQMSSNVAFLTGALSWALAAILSLIIFIRTRRFDRIMDFVVMLMSSFLIIIWFLVFRNHGYGHAWFMTRIICIIPTFGIVAALMSGREVFVPRQHY